MIWNWLRRRPLIVDLSLVVLVGLPTIVVATNHPHPLAGSILVTAETLPLIWRRGRPLAVLLTVTALAVLLVALGLWFLPFQLAIALYTLAATPAPRTTRSLGLVAIVVIALALTTTGHYTNFGDSALRVVFLIAAWLLGDSIG
jgi:hypothetical protein